MWRQLWQALSLSLLVSATIYGLLVMGDWLFPQMFRTHVEPYHFALLFAVAFVPRLIYWAIGRVLDAVRKQRRRRPRKT
jgi:hypothetical protein